MDSGNVSAIISASAGILGVLLGNGFVTVKEIVLTASKTKKDVDYLAILVVSHLDRFAQGCVAVSKDDGTNDQGEPADEGQRWAPTVKTPEFQPLDIKVEWKVLPQTLMYEIMRIPDVQEGVNRRISASWSSDDQPDYTEFFWTRRAGYAELGLKVTAVAKRLRAHAGFPTEDVADGESSRESELQASLQLVAEARATYEARVAEARATNPLWTFGASAPGAPDSSPT